MVITPPGGDAQCVFDGYVLSWQLHFDRTSTTSSLDVAAQDGSWLMNIDDTVTEWAGQTDGEVANAIFDSYGFTQADANTDDDSPPHDPDGHTLFQRATDLQFLETSPDGPAESPRLLLRHPGDRTGYFIRPSVDGQPVATLALADPNAWTVDTLDFDWDVMRPSQVAASQVDLTQASDDGTETDTDSSGLTTLADRDLPTYTGMSSQLLLTRPPTSTTCRNEPPPYSPSRASSPAAPAKLTSTGLAWCCAPETS